jgi:mRNA-degrading endonuclease RelE of RelBE toxin-antitoxin system
MMAPYTLLLPPTGRRALKKLPKPVQKQLLQKALALQTDPLQGAPLQGPFRFLRCLHLRLHKADYRIAYEVLPHKAQIVLHYIASRENFYQQLDRLNLKPQPKP